MKINRAVFIVVLAQRWGDVNELSNKLVQFYKKKVNPRDNYYKSVPYLLLII
jgi:hypothetical protein